MRTDTCIEVRGLTMRYGEKLIQRDLNFSVQRGDIFIIMGTSGCGKSTLLKHMIGLYEPSQGDILFDSKSFFRATEEEKFALRKSWGVTYQSGALFSAMTIAQNVAVPLQLHTQLSEQDIKELVHYKLSLVGLAGFEDYYPSEISGGMQKRAGLARAIALEPDYLFFDEPSAGLDPISSRLLDELIVELAHGMGTTVILVTHELPSIFDIGTNAVYLDTDEKTMLDCGPPLTLANHSPVEKVRSFLSRGKTMVGVTE